MKKIVTSLVLICLNTGFARAQTAPTATLEQQAQEVAGFIYVCATAKPILGWKSINISLDRTESGGMNLTALASTGSNQAKKITLCDRQQVAQALIDMLNLTTQGKNVEWQSLFFRAQPNHQTEFSTLTKAEVIKLMQTASKVSQ